jgi:DNA-binding transcriptional LysR family regulator
VEALNLYQLRILVAVVEHESVSRAAAALNLTQPSVSAQLVHLRRFAGTEILARDGRRIVLTEAGRALHRYAQEVLGATDALERELADISSGEHDHILIGGPLVYTTYLIPPVLAEFQLRHQSVHLATVSGSSREIIERVRALRLDAGVATVAPFLRHLADDVAVEHLCDDEWVIIESTQRPFSNGRTVDFERLAEIPFVRWSRPEAAAEGVLGRLATAAGLRPLKFIMDLDSWEGIKDAARAGIGAAVIPRSVVRRELRRRELAVVAVHGYHAPRSIDLVYSSRYHRRSAVFDELLDDMRAGIRGRVMQERDRLA